MAYRHGSDSSADPGRIAWLDHAKGLCIILVVMLYATEAAGEAAGREGWLHAVASFAQPFRMPDFFLLSGLLLSRVIQRDWRIYLDRKVVHFAYFYLLWLTILFAFQSPWMAAKEGWPAVGADYLRAFVHPFSMLWFIYLLPVFFVVTKLAHRAPVAVVWLIAAALQVAQPETGIKVLDKFTPYYVYFYTGFVLAPHICRLAEAACANRGKALLGLTLWAAFNGYLALKGYTTLPLVSLGTGLLGCAAVVVSTSLIAESRLSSPLAYCGRHSIVIYLAFFIPMTVTQRIIKYTKVTSDVGWTSFLAALGGVIGALVLYWLVRGTRLRFLFERPARLSLAPTARRGPLMYAD